MEDNALATDIIPQLLKRFDESGFVSVKLCPFPQISPQEIHHEGTCQVVPLRLLKKATSVNNDTFPKFRVVFDGFGYCYIFRQAKQANVKLSFGNRRAS